MISLRAACIVFAAIAAAVAPALAADTGAPKHDPRPGAQMVGLFRFRYDEPAEEPVLTADEPILPPKQQGPVILAQGLEQRAIIDDSAEANLADSEPFDPNATRLHESTWYTRIDYFQWQETFDGERYRINEGVAPTLGWQQRGGRQRYRFDVFGARPDYDASLNGEIISNVTDYLGLRGEYELMWEPPKWPHLSLFAGVGSRYFVRSTPDIIAQGMLISGYQQSWWTFYPYVGYETRRTMKTNGELYASCRVGMTAFTREHVSSSDLVLFPRPNIMLQSEIGWRGPRLSLACFTELMKWSVSPQVLNDDREVLHLVRQPQSAMITLGGKIAWSY